MIMTVNLDESSGTRSVGAQIERQLRARNPTDTSKVLIMNTKNIPISDENSGKSYLFLIHLDQSLKIQLYDYWPVFQSFYSKYFN